MFGTWHHRHDSGTINQRRRPSMRRHLALLLAVGVLTTGYSSQPSAATAAAEPSPSATAASGGKLDDATYYRLMRDIPQLAQHTDSQLDGIGTGSCGMLATGSTWVHVLKPILDSGMPAKDAGTVVMLTVFHSCPEHADKLPETLRADKHG